MQKLKLWYVIHIVALDFTTDLVVGFLHHKKKRDFTSNDLAFLAVKHLVFSKMCMTRK